MLVKSKKEYALIELPKAKIELKDKLKLEGMDMRLDHHAEWKQIFNESWRQMRDFFLRARTCTAWIGRPCAKNTRRCCRTWNHRNDLTYLIGEMIAELNIGHAYVGGGEKPEAPRIKLGLLGAEFSRDPVSTRRTASTRFCRAKIGAHAGAHRSRKSASTSRRATTSSR